MSLRQTDREGGPDPGVHIARNMARMVLREHLLDMLMGAGAGVLAAGVEPVVGSVAVADDRVDVLALHQIQRLV